MIVEDRIDSITHECGPKQFYPYSLIDPKLHTIFMEETHNVTKEVPLAGSMATLCIDQIRGLTCRVCGLEFSDRNMQLIHFKSEHHIVNLKRNLLSIDSSNNVNENNNSSCINEEDGESSSDSEDNTGNDDEVKNELDDKNSTKAYEYGSVSKTFSKFYGSLFIFHPIQSKWNLSLCSTIFDRNNIEIINPWNQLQSIIREFKSNLITCVIILRSGRFAGTIFDGHQPIIHKTFRRYTIRAKSGGGQSSHDNKGKKAKSAGAMLRRYGEQALKEDVRDLLIKWQSLLDCCAFIILSVPKLMRNVIFDDSSSSKDPPLVKNDSRIRDVTFMVGKPTFDETKNILTKCTTVNISPITITIIENDDNNNNNIHDDKLPIRNSNNIESVDKSHTKHASSGATTKSPSDSNISENTILIPTASNSPLANLLITACQVGNIDTVKSILQSMATDTPSSTTHSYDNLYSIESTINDTSVEENSIVSSSLPSCYQKNDTPPPLPTSTITSISMTTSSSIVLDMEKVNNNKLPETALLDSKPELVQYSQHITEALHINSDSTEKTDAHTPNKNILSVINIPNNIDELLSPLHIAASTGNSRLVLLLLQNGANPTQIDTRSRPPYFLATDKDTRDVFRKFRAINEDLWDWSLAGVPEGLTEEMERIQKEKEKEKKKRAKLRKKEQKEKDIIQLQELQERNKKIEEENKKEEELRKALLGNCAQCSKALFGLTVLDVFDRRVCSSSCVLLLRRKLAAEAAEKRLIR